MQRFLLSLDLWATLFREQYGFSCYGDSDHLLCFKLQGKLIVFQCQNEYKDPCDMYICAFLWENIKIATHIFILHGLFLRRKTFACVCVPKFACLQILCRGSRDLLVSFISSAKWYTKASSHSKYVCPWLHFLTLWQGRKIDPQLSGFLI